MRKAIRTIAILIGSGAVALMPGSAAGFFNSAPTANPNSFSAYACQSLTVNLTGNDTDAEGNYPLTVTSVGPASYGEFEIVSASSVVFHAGDTPGGETISYTVQDSLGASATGLINYGVFDRQCA